MPLLALLILSALLLPPSAHVRAATFTPPTASVRVSTSFEFYFINFHYIIATMHPTTRQPVLRGFTGATGSGSVYAFTLSLPRNDLGLSEEASPPNPQDVFLSNDVTPSVRDLDHDGMLDLFSTTDGHWGAAASMPGPHGIGWLGQPSVALAAATVEKSSFRTCLADIDGDAVYDVIVFVRLEAGGTSSIRWLRNTAVLGGVVLDVQVIEVGSGVQLVELPEGDRVLYMDAMDCDGDGKEDVLALVQSGGVTAFKVVRAAAPGVLQSVYEVGGAHDDFMLRNEYGEAHVLLMQKASGHVVHLVHTPGSQCAFAVRGDADVGANIDSTQVVLFDADHDGDVDVVAQSDSGLMAALYSRETSAYLDATVLTATDGPWKLVVSDLTGRGSPELCLYTSDVVTLYDVLPSRNFEQITTSIPLDSFVLEAGVVLAQLRDEALWDAVLVDRYSDPGTLRLSLQNAGTTTWQALTTAFTYPANALMGATAGDLNLDGSDEIVVLVSQSSTTATAECFRFDTTAGALQSCGTPSVLTVPSDLSFRIVQIITRFDLVGATTPDLLVVTSNANYIYAGNGAGGFEATATVTLPHLGREVAVADFDGDGLMDVAGGSPSELTVALNPGAGGSGEWSQSTFAHGAENFSNAPRVAVAVDWDGDMDMDIVVTEGENGVVCESNCDYRLFAVLWENLGNNEWRGHTLGETPDQDFVAVMDVDSDGVPEIIGRTNVLSHIRGSSSLQDNELVKFTDAFNAPDYYSTRRRLLPSVTASSADGHAIVAYFTGTTIDMRSIYSARPLIVRVDPASGSDRTCLRFPTSACASIAGALRLRLGQGSVFVIRLAATTHTVDTPLVLPRFSHRDTVVHVEGIGATIDCRAGGTCLSIELGEHDDGSSLAAVRFTGAPLTFIGDSRHRALHAVDIPHLSLGHARWMLPCDGIVPCNMADLTTPTRYGEDPTAKRIVSSLALYFEDSGPTLQLHNVEVGNVDDSNAAVYLNGGVAARMSDVTLNGNPTRGMWIRDFSDQVHMRYMSVHDNTVQGRGGAGMTVTRTSIEMADCEFARNSAHWEESGGEVLGGGLLLEGRAEATLARTVFDQNEVSGTACGAGLAVVETGVADAQPVIKLDACSFLNNQARDVAVGGGFCALLTKVDMTDVTVSGNAAAHGGGMYLTGASRVSITDSLVSENTARESGGAVYQDLGELSVTTSTLTSNSATQDGGAVDLRVGLLDISSMTIVSDNLAGRHGGLVNCEGAQTGSTQGVVRVSETDIVSSSAGGSGGALHVSNCGVMLTNSTLEGNNAQDDGGAVWLSSTSALRVVTAVNTQFTRNVAVAGNGGALYVDSIGLTNSVDSGTTAFTSNTALNSGGGVAFFTAGSVVNLPAALSGNAAKYGPQTATPASSFAILVDTVSSTTQAPRVFFVGQLQVGLLDALGQVVRSAQGTAREVTANDASAVGTVERSLSEGLAEFGGVFGLEASPSTTYEVRFQAVVGTLSFLSEPVLVTLGACPAGTFVEEGVRCTACPIGFFASTANAFECTICPKGTAQNITRAETCRMCPAGHFSGFEGSVGCVECPAGRANRQAGASACDECEAGRFSGAPGQLECEDCRPGSAIATNGSQFCPLCIPGRFQRQAGQVSCDLCANHTVTGVSGRTACQECTPPSFTDDEGSSECDECPPGRYADFHVFNASAVNVTARKVPLCRVCPANAFCDRSTGDVRPRPGYWADNVLGRVVVYECPTEDSCRGDNECQEGRKPASENPLCASCEEGLYEWGSECVECDGTRWELVVALVVIASAFTLVFHVLSQSTTGELKIALYFAQMVLLFVGPENGFVVYTLQVVNFQFQDATGTSCVTPLSPHQRIMFNFVGPLLALAVWLVLLFLSWLRFQFLAAFCCCMSKPKPARPSSSMERVPSGGGAGLRFSAAPYLRTLISLFLFMYNGILETTLQYLTCIDVTLRGRELSVVQAYPSVSCESDVYKRYHPFMVAILVLEVAVIPLFLLFKLVRGRKDGRSLDTEWQRVFGVLYTVYRGKLFWWQLYSTLRRTLQVLVFVQFAEERTNKFAAAALLNVSFLTLHMALSPFRKRQENVVEGTSLLLQTVVTIALPMFQEPYSDRENLLIMSISFVPAVLFLLWALATKVLRIGRRVQQCCCGSRARPTARSKSDAAEEVEMDSVVSASDADRLHLKWAKGSSRSGTQG